MLYSFEMGSIHLKEVYSFNGLQIRLCKLLIMHIRLDSSRMVMFISVISLTNHLPWIKLSYYKTNRLSMHNCSRAKSIIEGFCVVSVL